VSTADGECFQKLQEAKHQQRDCSETETPPPRDFREAERRTRKHEPEAGKRWRAILHVIRIPHAPSDALSTRDECCVNFARLDFFPAPGHELFSSVTLLANPNLNKGTWLAKPLLLII